MVKVSVIIPVYNSQRYLKECLDSVLSQTLENLEVICVNDGSTDSSLSILEGYAQKDKRVRVLSKDNGGSAAARNLGLNVAKGEYIYFVDNDDLLEEGALETYVKVADRDLLDVVYSNPNWVCESHEMVDPYSRSKDPSEEQMKVQTGKELFTSLINSSNYYAAPWKRFIRREYLDSIECRFCEQASPHEDNLFSFRVDIDAGKVAFIKTRFYIHRSHNFSTMITNEQKKNLGPKVVSHFLCAYGIMSYVSEKNLSTETKNAVMHRVNGLINRSFELFKEGGSDLSSLNWYDRWVESKLFSHMVSARGIVLTPNTNEGFPFKDWYSNMGNRTFLSKLGINLIRVDLYRKLHGWGGTIKRVLKVLL